MKYEIKIWKNSCVVECGYEMPIFDNVNEAIEEAKSLHINDFDGCIIEVVEIDNDDEFTNNFIYNETVDVNSITEQIRMSVIYELSKKYKVHNIKYFEIPLNNGKYLTLRIADHSGFAKNLSKNDTEKFASIVIANLDATEKRANLNNELEFNSNNDANEILEAIEYLIKRY